MPGAHSSAGLDLSAATIVTDASRWRALPRLPRHPPTAPEPHGHEGANGRNHVQQEGRKQPKDDADVEPHERPGNADQGIGDVSYTRGARDLPPDPAPALAVEDDAHDDADGDQDDECEQGRCDKGACRSPDGQMRSAGGIVSRRRSRPTGIADTAGT